MGNKDLQKFIERYLSIENELQLLKDDKKELFEEYKENFKPSVIREAIRQAKLRTRLGDDVVQLDELVAELDGKLQ
tara:strand:+ start:400 stop:627 length:228 start_codon:yes stop_codon:yes gene_type:complete